jgi:hypothetical protein
MSDIEELTFLHILRPLDALLDLGFVGEMLLTRKCLVQTCPEIIVSLRIFPAHEKQVYISLAHRIGKSFGSEVALRTFVYPNDLVAKRGVWRSHFRVRRRMMYGVGKRRS